MSRFNRERRRRTVQSIVMNKIVIEYDPKTGNLEMQGPADKTMCNYMLDVAKNALLRQQPTPEPAIAVAPAALLERFNGKG